jgi:malate synthase
VNAGHDGTWVAHPGLVPVAKEVFAALSAPHQIAAEREPVEVLQADLLAVPDGEITEAGLRLNLDVGVQYVASWLSGTGCVPIYHLMEDAATAEISRSQVWQWVRHGARLADGREVSRALVQATLREEMDKLRARGGPVAARLDEAGELFAAMTLAEEMPEFLTLVAYERLP